MTFGKFRYRPIRRRTWGVVALLAFLTCGLVAVLMWQAGSGPRKRYPSLEQIAASSVAVDADTELRIQMFCGDCHAVPRPESFPRDRWSDGVQMGYEYYARSGRNDLDPPPIHVVTAYFRSRAPARLVFPVPEEAPAPFAAGFTRESVDWQRSAGAKPGIAHLRYARLRPDQDPVLLVCDMADGTVAAVELARGHSRRTVLARFSHPCQLEVCDLDGNGQIDLIVADLGSFFAMDHDRGRVVWLRPREEGDSYEEIVLASGLGRVADVRVADMDGAGDLDLVVAEFGHHRTGRILLLRNVARQGELPRFEIEEIDPRPGTIHVPLHDFNHDGHLDFAALVSQEHECVDLFLNQGNGRFHRHAIWAGPDLSFGSSGLELVDLNQDGRMDLLTTNGDSFDNFYANPSHGVQWLENLGGLRFASHRLADLPGAYRALAGDFDRDGDLDLIVTAWLPLRVMPPELQEERLSSILLLEQTSPGRFVRHTLETGSPHYPAMEVADFDGDGRLDFVVGLHTGLDDPESFSQAPLAVWWNQGASPAGEAASPAAASPDTAR